MQIVPSLLFGISASLDALLVGISYGIRKIRISFWHNLLVSSITLLGTCLSVGLGTRLVRFLPASWGKLAGSIILIFFGVYYITRFMIASLKKYHQKKQLTATSVPAAEAKVPSGLSLLEACTLGCALSANNIGIGLSASIAGLSLIPAAVVTLLFSTSFLFLGNRLGQCRLLQLTGDSADVVSGLLLVGLGILELPG